MIIEAASRVRESSSPARMAAGLLYVIRLFELESRRRASIVLDKAWKTATRYYIAQLSGDSGAAERARSEALDLEDEYTAYMRAALTCGVLGDLLEDIRDLGEATKGGLVLRNVVCLLERLIEKTPRRLMLLRLEALAVKELAEDLASRTLYGSRRTPCRGIDLPEPEAREMPPLVRVVP